MKLLIYTSNGGISEKNVSKILSGFSDKEDVEVYSTSDSLLKRLTAPRGSSDLILLVFDNQQDLEELMLLKKMFFNVPIVIVLPDRKKTTIRQGLKFYPRYIGYADSSLKDVQAVLKKIKSNIR